MHYLHSQAKARLAAAVVLAVGAFLGMTSHSSAATIYYDTNGTADGTGAGATDWNSGNANWNTDSTGVATPVAWSSSGAGNLDGSDVVFSAGTNAPATYNMNIGGNKVSNSITINQGAITLHFASSSGTTGSRTIGAGGITLNQPDPTPNTPLTFLGPTTAGNFNVILSASQTWTNNSGATNAITFTPAPVPGTGLLTLSGNATAGNTYTVTLGGSAAGAYNFGVVVSDGAAGGQLAIATSKNTNFTNVVSTYSGGTSITSGTSLLDNGGGLGHSNIAIAGGTLAGGTTGAGGSLTDNILDNTGELIALSGSGVLDLTNLNFTLAATGTQTQAEYVLANAAVGSANILGTQFLAANLPSGWSINYSGTAANPNAIVLVNANVAVPEPASLGLLGLGALALIRRRRSA